MDEGAPIVQAKSQSNEISSQLKKVSFMLINLVIKSYQYFFNCCFIFNTVLNLSQSKSMLEDPLIEQANSQSWSSQTRPSQSTKSRLENEKDTSSELIKNIPKTSNRVPQSKSSQRSSATRTSLKGTQSKNSQPNLYQQV